MRHLNLQEQKLYVVDGQHRVEALRLLFEEDPQRWGSMGVPFVCMLGANEEEEMEQFYAVNANSKSVPTGLAFDLLKQQASNNASLFQELQETGKAWIIRGGDIVEHLESAPIWAGRVRFTGQPKAATTVGNDGFVNSLRPLLNSPFFSQMETDDQIQVLQAFWSGVKIVLPDAFDEPGDYVLQKSTGVATLHLLLVSVIELVRNKNQSLIDPESYSQMLEKPFQSLSEVSPTGEAVSGSDFWKSGGQGAAGSFSSNAGRRVLVARLRENLPKVSIT
jgi:DGQHR domain-containing protein